MVAALAARGETVWFALANAVWCLASLVGHGSAIMVGAAIAQPLTGLLIDRASPIVANLAAVGITALVATFAAQFGGTTSLRRAP